MSIYFWSYLLLFLAQIRKFLLQLLTWIHKYFLAKWKSKTLTINVDFFSQNITFIHMISKINGCLVEIPKGVSFWVIIRCLSNFRDLSKLEFHSFEINMCQIEKQLRTIPKIYGLLGKIKKKYKSESNFRNFTSVEIPYFWIHMCKIVKQLHTSSKIYGYYVKFQKICVFDTSRKFTKNGIAAQFWKYLCI